jgi:ketosteroid isomerase-like protein
MLRTLFAACAAAALAFASPAAAGPAEDATAVVTTAIDKFNKGDTKAFFAAHMDDALIVDEFAPYLWGGSGSPKRWLDTYMKDAAAKGISDGRIDYGKPMQAVSDGVRAYVVLPTTYRFAQKGKKMAGKGSMTFILARTSSGWKIAGWTYSGATPTPE